MQDTTDNYRQGSQLRLRLHNDQRGIEWVAGAGGAGMRLTREGSSWRDLSTDSVTCSGGLAVDVNMVFDNEQIAEWLANISCPMPIQVRGKCKEREPLVIENVSIIEERDGEFVLDMAPVDLARLWAFLATDGQDTNDE